MHSLNIKKIYRDFNVSNAQLEYISRVVSIDLFCSSRDAFLIVCNALETPLDGAECSLKLLGLCGKAVRVVALFLLPFYSLPCCESIARLLCLDFTLTCLSMKSLLKIRRVTNIHSGAIILIAHSIAIEPDADRISRVQLAPLR